MATEDLARADPVGRIVSWLKGHPSVLAVVGSADRIGSDNRPPYPRVRITDPPGGDDRLFRRLVTTVVQVDVYGDLDGTLAKGDLKQVCYIVLSALAELPDQPVPSGAPVITHVESLLGAGWQPEPTGQGRYISQVRVYSHASRV